MSLSWPPPLKSKYRDETTPTLHQLKMRRRAERNEKARLRMARKRAELRARSLEEQQLAAERSRAYQAKYREKHRARLRTWEALRRLAVYRAKYGNKACTAYQERKYARQEARERDMEDDGDDDDDSDNAEYPLAVVSHYKRSFGV